MPAGRRERSCQPRRRSSGCAPTRWSTPERRIEARIAERVPPGLRRALEHLLNETVDAGVTRFVWLRQFEPGSNSADANRLLDRLDHLQRLDFPEGLFDDVPAHRITRTGSHGCAGRENATSPTGCGRTRSGAGCCAANPTTACERRRCCSTCATRSVPAIIIYWKHVEAWRGRLRQAEGRPRDPGGIPDPRLAARMGTHQPDRRIPMAGHANPRRLNVNTLSVGFRPLPQTTRWGAHACVRGLPLGAVT